MTLYEKSKKRDLENACWALGEKNLFGAETFFILALCPCECFTRHVRHTRCISEGHEVSVVGAGRKKEDFFF